MKEKTKQILRYVACGLGGLALGIGLLGGLSMCATSGKKTAESVNTILTNERVRHNANITTEGGFAGYKFSFDLAYSEVSDGYAFAYTYEMNTTTYEPSLYGARTGDISTYAKTQAFINERYEASRSSTSGDLRFLLIYGKMKFVESSTTYYNFLYSSFVLPNAGSGNMGLKNFVCTDLPNNLYLNRLDSDRFLGQTSANNYYLLTINKNNAFVYSENVIGPAITFQDVTSYYQELGYQEGHQTGYEKGYEDAYAEKDSGIAFTSCGVYPNAHVTLATDETIGNFNYMYLCHYITKPGYDEHTIYIMWTTNANTGQYLGEVIDRNDTDSYDPAVTLGSFTQEVTPSVTITATQDIEFGLWVGYITTFHNRGEVTNSILWFQGGTSESDMQIYQNGYDEGYQNGNQAGQETGYEQGYERGQEVGDAEGYSRGYTEGFNQTNTKNVFSLFTSAFDSVASFFDLKIFGFLPLYWFFLAPLFIALISLLMRMVKH